MRWSPPLKLMMLSQAVFLLKCSTWFLTAREAMAALQAELGLHAWAWQPDAGTLACASHLSYMLGGGPFSRRWENSLQSNQEAHKQSFCIVCDPHIYQEIIYLLIFDSKNLTVLFSGSANTCHNSDLMSNGQNWVKIKDNSITGKKVNNAFE